MDWSASLQEGKNSVKIKRSPKAMTTNPVCVVLVFWGITITLSKIFLKYFNLTRGNIFHRSFFFLTSSIYNGKASVTLRVPDRLVGQVKAAVDYYPANQISPLPDPFPSPYHPLLSFIKTGLVLWNSTHSSRGLWPPPTKQARYFLGEC